MEGLDVEKVNTIFGKDAAKKILLGSKKWEAGEKLKIKNQKIVLTKAGKLFADGIAADLFFD